MNEIQAMLDAREKYLTQLIKEKEKALKKVPEGSLRISNKRNTYQYYQRTNPKDHTGTFIRQENMNFARKLAQKDYDEKVLRASEKEGVPYRYEYPLYLKGLGIIHPDFLMLNVRTRKEIIWEHLGRLADSNYSENNVNRINKYINNGFYPGENIIFTYETSGNPLNQKIVKQMIEHYLK